MKYIIAITLFGMLVSGCVGTEHITESWSPQSAANLSRMNRDISGKRVTLVLDGRRSIQASDVYVAEDSTSGFTIGVGYGRWLATLEMLDIPYQVMAPSERTVA